MVALQVRAWERGQRASLPGREAANLLWTLPVATILDGRLEAWRDVAGVDELDAGLTELLATDRAELRGAPALSDDHQPHDRLP